MADYKVSGTDLISVADAIRTKGGTSASLSFPDGFISAVQNIPAGGSATLISKTITANGTYDASSDNADGFSDVSVSVPQPPYVTGTFKGTSAQKGTAINIPLSYSGSGYPILVVVYPKDGILNPDSIFYQTVQRYAIQFYCGGKNNPNTTPDFTTHGIDQNSGTIFIRYKGSASDATAYTTGNGTGNGEMFSDRNASDGGTSCVRFTGRTSMSVYIANTSYGFMADVDYTYHVVFSE